MVEISYLNNGTLGSPAGTTVLVGVPQTGSSGIGGTLYPVNEVFSAGLEAQSGIGTISIAGTDTVAISHNGTVYLATLVGIVEASGAAAPPLPDSAALLGSNSGGTAEAVAVGTGLNLSGGTLTSTGESYAAGSNVEISSGTISVPLTDSAPLLGATSGGSFAVVAVGSNLTLAGGTLSASGGSLPDSAPLLGSNAGGTATSVAVGSGLNLSGGTLTSTASTYVGGIDISVSSGTINLAAPTSAPLLSTNSGGSLVAIALGSNLSESGGTLNAAGASLPTSAQLLGSNSGGTAVAVDVGSGLLLSAGTLSSTGSTYAAGSGIAISSGTISVDAPASAALLASNSGGTLEAIVLGTGLSSSGGTLSATGGTTYTAGIDIDISSGTINLNPPTSAPLLASNSGGSLVSVAIGSGLASSGGTLANTYNGIKVTDGTTTVSGALTLSLTGATVSGSSPNADITISGGGGSVPMLPGIGQFLSSGSWVRPALSSLGTSGAAGVTATDIASGPIKFVGGVGNGTFMAFQAVNDSNNITLSALLGFSPRYGIGNNWGIFMADQASGNALVWWIAANGGNPPVIYCSQWTNFSTTTTVTMGYNSNPFDAQIPSLPSVLGFRMVLDVGSSNFQFELSTDPVDDTCWVPWGTQNYGGSNWMTAVTHAGVVIGDFSNLAADFMNVWGLKIANP